MIAAVVLVAAGAVPADEIASAIHFPTLLLLGGLMILSARVGAAGFYNAAAAWIARQAGRPLRLLALTIAVGGTLSAFLVNDIVVFAMTPLLCAGLDGIKQKIDPVAAGFGPLEENIYDLPPEKAAKIRSVPGSLRQSLDALRNDHAYLTETGVFTDDFIDLWIAYKTERELKPVEIRPHPYEFYLYYDA